MMSDDKYLVAQIAKKDKVAFSELYQHYQPRVLRYCGRLLNQDVETAADIADEVFFQVWQKAANFRGDSSVKTWLFSIAHHLAVSYIRKNREISLDNEDQVHELVSPDTSQIAAVGARQQQVLLTQALEKLSSEHKSVLHLFYYSEMSIKEISQVLDINDRTVRTRLHYAKKALIPILSELGINAEVFFDGD